MKYLYILNKLSLLIMNIALLWFSFHLFYLEFNLILDLIANILQFHVNPLILFDLSSTPALSHLCLLEHKRIQQGRHKIFFYKSNHITNSLDVRTLVPQMDIRTFSASKHKKESNILNSYLSYIVIYVVLF